MAFALASDFHPTGDQPRAIAQLTGWLAAGHPHMTLLGVTGSGKSFTFANVIAARQQPALVISPNKTLAAQLYGEMKAFFPSAAVHYFVSYYDYYQPEAYVPASDTYIEKEAQINEEIDRLRHASTQSLLTRDDVIIVASVSCIYGLGSPEAYGSVRVRIATGERHTRRELLRSLVDIHYTRNDVDLSRGTFRAKGDTVEVYPKANDQDWVRIEFDRDTVERITVRDIGGTVRTLDTVTFFPATHYLPAVVSPRPPETHGGEGTKAGVAPAQDTSTITTTIRAELDARLTELRAADKLVEAQRLEQRVRYDCDMLDETGYVHGIENYSRYFDGRQPGEPPYTLVDFFNYSYGVLQGERASGLQSFRALGPERSGSQALQPSSPPSPGWLCFIDESHVTIPQLRGMHAGDRSRKQTLIDFGFRLPSALDNRPLRFDEFTARVPQTIYVSATPEEYELAISTTHRKHGELKGFRASGPDDNSASELQGGRALGQEYSGSQALKLSGSQALKPSSSHAFVAEQLIRPTGLLDPRVEVRPTEGQIPDLLREVAARTAQQQRTLVTVLTKRMAEDLAEHLRERGITACHLHADVETFERVEILDDLRRGVYDVVVGINLLREGLDLPEVSLVAVLDADQEGFLRSQTALIQVMGRAARHVNGTAILYADRITEAMRFAIAEVERRRTIQEEYNIAHGITPQSIVKAIRGPMVAPADRGEDATQHQHKRPKRRRR